ncbi:MAG: hypothetical protein EBS49_08225 [Verrucomicrobia bacterium]|nr:hypothetical protein [Verrucomicrobiota bacterium]
MNSLTYTKIFLQTQEKSIDEVNIRIHHRKWFRNTRSKNKGGLRLTPEGYTFLIEDMKLKEYEVPFTGEIDLNPQLIIFFDQFLDCPYYLTTRSLTVFSERKAFELHFFADDIRKYGLMKALKKQQKAEDLLD